MPVLPLFKLQLSRHALLVLPRRRTPMTPLRHTPLRRRSTLPPFPTQPLDIRLIFTSLYVRLDRE